MAIGARLAGLMAATLLGGVALAQTVPHLPAHIAAAAADPARAEQAKSNSRRHGPEILAFAGVRPGDRVIDLMPGGGYWTRLLAKAVGPKGHVYGIWPAPLYAEDKEDGDAYARLLADPGFANVSSSIQPAEFVYAPAKADLVFTSQNYHDYPDKFMGPTDPEAFDRAVFAALKPGGTFLIIDHAAAKGSGLRDTDTLHRIDPAVVKAQVIRAGFRFVGESPLLANPADDHSKLVFDKSIRGHTDQFIYKFRKPR